MRIGRAAGARQRSAGRTPAALAASIGVVVTILAGPLDAAEPVTTAGSAAEATAESKTESTADSKTESTVEATAETVAQPATEESPADEPQASPSAASPGPTPPQADRVAPPPVGTRFAEPLEGNRLRIRYLWRRTKAQGMMVGDRDAPPHFVFQNPNQPFIETARALDVSVHTVEIAYAPHPRTTLIVQIPFVQRSLETVDAFDVRRKDQTDGLGDVLLGLAVPFIRKRNQMSHVHVAFDFPTGDYRKHDASGLRLPYDSQLGNGSVDFEWGWTYRGSHARFVWGGQAVGRHAVEQNGLNYREGSRFEGSLWGGARLAGGLSATVRGVWQKSSNLHGRDSAFDVAPNQPGEQAINPARLSQARGGTRLLVAPGLAWDLPGVLRGHRLSVEAAIPVYQNLDGPQLEQDWILTTGWQWAF